jgi:hypothetical protein
MPSAESEYNRLVMAILEKLETITQDVSDLPCPESGVYIDWSHVYDLHRIFNSLDEVAETLPGK